MKNLIYLFLAGALALASCSKDDDPIAVGSVSLDKTTLTLTVGQTSTLTATVQPDNAHDKTVVWQSSNTAVATISDAGLVTAVSLGTATITATAGRQSATCSVSVDPTPVESITLEHNELSLLRGQSITLTATVLPDDATDKTVTWRSTKPDIATVDDNGKVTALSLGFTVIYATSGDAITECVVRVEPDVYVVGHNGREGIDRKGILWKNGEPTELSLRDANSIYIDGDGIRIAGNFYNESGLCAGVWKDGTIEIKGLGNTSAEAVIMNEGKELVAVNNHSYGDFTYYQGSDMPIAVEPQGVPCNLYSIDANHMFTALAGNRKRGTPEYTATLWLSFTPYDLTDGTKYAEARSAVLFYFDYYVVGHEGTGNQQQAVLWERDNKRTDLPQGVAGMDVYFYDKTVYAVGSCRNGDKQAPAMWKDGELTKLGTDGCAMSVVVYNNNVYIAGYDEGKAVVWKNGVPTTLANQGTAMSIFLY